MRTRLVTGLQILVLAVPALTFSVGVGPAAASGEGQVTMFPANVFRPTSIAAGPDHALWFTSGNTIGRINTLGQVRYFTGPGISLAWGIASGPDGAIWFTNHGNNSIGRVTTAGVVSNYTGSRISQPIDVVAGSDGAMWFTNRGNGSIGRITTAGVVTNFTGAGISRPTNITRGPGNHLWFINSGNTSIGRITPTGKVSNYTHPDLDHLDQLSDITAGPDGALWFIDRDEQAEPFVDPIYSIGRITTSGEITLFPDLGVDVLSGLTAGPDGALWSSDFQEVLLRITTEGAVTHFDLSTTHDTFVIDALTAGPDGAVWFTVGGPASIGRITTTVTPGIASFEPREATPGDQVTISGENLSGATRVAFNGTTATIVSNTETTVVAVVPAGATSGRINVTTSAGRAVSATTFAVRP